MNTERLTYLFNKYYDKTNTPEERKELMDSINEGENDPVINNLIDEALQKTQGELQLDNHTAAAILQSIIQADKEQKPAIVRPMRRFNFSRAVAAAVIVILISTGAYFLLNRKTPAPIIAKTEQQFKNDVAPGGNKAILTLANGKQIILDSAANGTLTQQGNTKIIKLDSGQITYNESTKAPSPSERAGGEAVAYNTITTPKGGQYQIILADGSKVWLNAASSLRYPTSFAGNERNVELTGEGYFEVAHNAKTPFRVKVNDMTVQVLGTHFNINAYNDESVIKTTLLEGSVKVTLTSPSLLSLSKGERDGVRLKPGEQAQIENHGNPLIPKITVQTVDVSSAVAWKNGLFNFSDADLQTVLRQLARWYDVDVVYEGAVPKRAFEGKMQRNLNLSEVLMILEKNNVHFKIDGKKIVVTP